MPQNHRITKRIGLNIRSLKESRYCIKHARPTLFSYGAQLLLSPMSILGSNIHCLRQQCYCASKAYSRKPNYCNL